VKRLTLERLQDRFMGLIQRHLDENDQTQGELAEQLQMQRTHLNMLLNGTRPLSAYYVMKCIQRGVFKVADIYDGNATTKREEEFWATASEAENHALLHRIARLRRKGIDVDSYLNIIDPESNGDPKKR